MPSIIKPLELSPVTCIKAPTLSAIASAEEGDFQDFVVTSDDLDRDQEIIDQDGIDMTWFTQGPAAWFFNHQSLPFPIGSSKQNPKDPGSTAVVRRDGRRWVARCFFNRLFPEAVIVADLVKMGHLAYTSIGFLSLSREHLSDEDSIKLGSTYPVMIHKKTQLTEISIVGIPANPAAISEHLSRGMVNGTTITPLMTKQMRRWIGDEQKIYAAGSSMFPHQQEKSTIANAINDKPSTTQSTIEVVPVSQTVEKCGTPKPEPTITPVVAAPVAKAEEKPAVPVPVAAAVPAKVVVKAEGDNGENDDGDSHDQKAGYQMMLALREGINNLLKGASDMMPSVDNEMVRELAGSMCRGLVNGMQTLSDAASEVYEGFPEMEETEWGFGEGKSWWEGESDGIDDDGNKVEGEDDNEDETDESDNDENETDDSDDSEGDADEDEPDDEEKSLIEQLTKVTEELEEAIG